MLGLICSACSVTRKIPEGQYLLQKVKIDADKVDAPQGAYHCG